MIQRVLRGKPATISVTFTDQNGLPQDATGVTFIVHRDSTGGTVTVGTPAPDASYPGRWTATLAAARTADLDVFTVTATADDGSEEVAYVEVVGGYYFTLFEAREAQPTLQDTAKYSDELLIRCRQEVETEFERICGQAFVPRYCKETLDGYFQSTILLANTNPRTIRSVEVEGIDLTTDQVNSLRLSPTGLVEWPYLRWPARTGQNVTVTYEHGMNTPPEEVKRAAITRLRQRLNMALTGVDDRTTNYSAPDGGSYSLAVAGRGGFETGSPDVDAVLDRYKVGAAGVA